MDVAGPDLHSAFAGHPVLAQGVEVFALSLAISEGRFTLAWAGSVREVVSFFLLFFLEGGLKCPQNPKVAVFNEHHVQLFMEESCDPRVSWGFENYREDFIVRRSPRS